MKTLNTILGSVALLVASNAVVSADDLLAGPLPVGAGVGTGTVTCSVTNAAADFAFQQSIFISDANFVQIASINCGFLEPHQSCSTSVTFSPNSPTVPQSPFICQIGSIAGTSVNTRVRGSICGTVSDPQTGFPGSTYCLQALIDNGQSGGWTPSGGP
jgi:hypothetical protein